MDKLLSVVIPVYNVEKYLHECVDSIINQTYRNLEIILVDDGTPDNSGKICDEYAAKDKRVRVIHQENRGLGGARNRGLKEATGEYITFVDSDDYLLENAFEICMKAVIDNGFDFVIFGSFRSGNGGAGTGKIMLIDPYEYWKDCLVKGGALAWGAVMLRSLWKDIYYPEHQNFEEIPVSYRVAKRLKNPARIDKEIYYYRKNPTGICSTSGLKPESRYGYIVSCYDRLQYAIKHGVGELESRSEFLKSILSYFTAVYGTKAAKDTKYYKALDLLKIEREKPYSAEMLNPKYKAYLWCCGRLDFIHYYGARLSYFSKIAKGYSK